tara:strand:+ start:6067 stop:9375 length:3309 start_codon:yes stop_codon:yes gene_type:complete
MANSIDLIVSKQAQQGLDQLYESLRKTNEELLKASKTQLNFAGGSSPKNLQEFNLATQNYTKNQQQLTAVEKERLRVERALETTQARIATANDKNTQSLTQQRGVLKTLNSEYAKLSQRHNEAARAVQDLIARGKLATQTQAQYNRELQNAQGKFNQLNSKVIQADTAVKRFNRNVGNYPSAAAQNIRSLLGAFGLVSGIYLFAQAIRGAFTTIKDFDKANADLAATMGKTRKDITALTNDQKRLGAATKFTATEVAGLQKEFAKLGFSDKEILNATEATLALAAAVDTDLANAAMVAGATLRGFGLDASETGRVTDVMASSFTKSALDISNFSEAMKYVAPIAGQTGVSIEFATAMLGKLADAGVKGSQAGTSLRRILTEMAKTGLPAAQAFDKVAKSGISVTDAMDEVGRTAQTALLVLSKNKTAVSELALALDDAGGAAQKMADEQLQSLSGQLTLLASAWDGFILSLSNSSSFLGGFFTQLISETKNALEGLTFLLNSAEENFENFKSKLSKEVESSMTDAIFEKQKGLQKEILKVNILIDKQLALLEKHPNNEIAKAELKLLEDKRRLLQSNLDIETKEIELNSKFAIADLQKTIDLQEEKLKRLNYELEFIKEQEKTLGRTLSTAKRYADTATAIEKIEKSITINKAEQLAYQSALSTVTKKELEKPKGATAPKAVKENLLEQVDTNSAAAFKRQISLLEHQLDITSKTSAEYGTLAFMLKVVKDAYKAMYGEAEKATEVVKDAKFGTADYYENLISVLKKEQSELATSSNEWQHYNRMIETVEIDLKRLTGTVEDNKAKLKEWSDEYRKSFTDDFISNSGFDKIFFIMENFENLKESGVDSALAISEAFQQAFNTISQASQANFEQEFQRLERQKEISILFAGESITAKEEIERQYEERRRQIERRKAESEKRLAIFNAVIDTAQAVVAALPNYALAAAVGILGAAQVALIASQPIPAFAEGGVHDGGLMLVNDAKGSNYREVIETPDGKLSSPTGRNVVMNAPKGTKIHTPEQWDAKLNSMLLDVGINPIGNAPKIEIKNGITKEEMTQIMSKFANKDSYEFNIDENGIKKMITRNGQKVNILNSRLRIKGNDV